MKNVGIFGWLASMSEYSADPNKNSYLVDLNVLFFLTLD